MNGIVTCYFSIYLICYELMIYESKRLDKLLGAVCLLTLWEMFVVILSDLWVKAWFNFDILPRSNTPGIIGYIAVTGANLYCFLGGDRGRQFINKFQELPDDVRTRTHIIGYSVFVLTFLVTFISMWCLLS